MNAVEQTESPSFEDVNENTSSGSAEATDSGSVEATDSGSVEAAPTNATTDSGSVEATDSGSVEAPAADSPDSNSSRSNSSSSNSSSSNSNATVKANKKGMSVAAKTVLSDRMKTLAEMREAYAKAFGDDPKAPKAKSYEAFALTKIRKEQGEEAFKSKLQEYIERNQGIHAAKPAKGTRKKVAIATNAAVNVTTAGPINRGNSRQKLIQSVRTMADSAKDLIDNLVSTTMSLAKTNTGDMTSIATRAVSAVNGTAKHRKTRSNKGKTHKRSAVKMNNSSAM